MTKINTVIDIVLFYFLAAALAVVVGVCFVQVVARYLFNSSFSWAEEVSIIFLLWATWGGACLAAKQGVHLRIFIIADRVTPRTNLMLRLALNCLAIPFLGAVALNSKVVLNGMAYMSLYSLPSVPMTIMYANVPVGCILLIYYLMRLITIDWKSLKAFDGK